MVYIEDSVQPSVEEGIVTKELERDIGDVLSLIDKKDANIIRLYHGLGSREKSYSFEEIGAFMELPKERVRERYVLALKKIRESKDLSERLYVHQE